MNELHAGLILILVGTVMCVLAAVVAAQSNDSCAPKQTVNYYYPDREVQAIHRVCK